MVATGDIQLGETLTPVQVQASTHRRRFNVHCWGRRTGKSELGLFLAGVTGAIDGLPCGWFAPTYKMMSECWGALAHRLAPVATRIRHSEHRMELQGGGVIEFWSLESEGAGRSRKYGRVIVDEAALVPDLKERWEQDIRPTLSDLRGDAFFFSSPRGHDYFWELWSRGFDPLQQKRWLSSQVPTLGNPYIDAAEIEEARDLLPQRVYEQEYLALFLEDNAVFRGIHAAAHAQMQVERREGHRYVVGVDWGKYEDFTVMTVIDTTLNEHVYTERMKQINYMAQIPRLLLVNDRFKPVEIVVENNLNDALMEHLYTYDLPLTEFRTLNQNKQGIIEDLQMAIERQDLLIQNDPVLIGELQAFGVERTKTGRLRYAARSGYHDDCVMSMAMAWSAARDDGEVQPIQVRMPIAQRMAQLELEAEYA